MAQVIAVGEGPHRHGDLLAGEVQLGVIGDVLTEPAQGEDQPGGEEGARPGHRRVGRRYALLHGGEVGPQLDQGEPLDAGVRVEHVPAIPAPVGLGVAGDQRPVGLDPGQHGDEPLVPPGGETGVGVDLERVGLTVVEPPDPVPGPATAVALEVGNGIDPEPGVVRPRPEVVDRLVVVLGADPEPQPLRLRRLDQGAGDRARQLGVAVGRDLHEDLGPARHPVEPTVTLRFRSPAREHHRSGQGNDVGHPGHRRR